MITSLFINAQSERSKNDSVSIGLLVNDRNEAVAVCSAELAVKQINDQGGIKGKPLKLIIRSVEGSWGAGSSKVVDLVFKEKVLALVGSIDGRNSHLAEQVIAKTQVLYLSAWASDPTLSKAYVPWYFSLVPNDDQQASFMLEKVRVQNKFQQILVVFDQSYDAEQALESIDQVSNGMEKLKIDHFPFHSLESLDLKERLEGNTFDAIILLGRQIPVTSILKQLELSGKSIPVYANLAARASTEYLSDDQKDMNELKPVTRDFHKIYLEKCKIEPDPVASYTYDAIMIMAKALKKASNDHDDLLETMSGINYQGVTGVVEFDSLGRLKNTGELLLIKE